MAARKDEGGGELFLRLNRELEEQVERYSRIAGISRAAVGRIALAQMFRERLDRSPQEEARP